MLAAGAEMSALRSSSSARRCVTSSKTSPTTMALRCGTFWRAAYDSPWWAFPSSREGRFHRAGQDTVQYLSLHPFGPAAGMLRSNVGPDGDPDDVVLKL